jgi:hypothetical protein
MSETLESFQSEWFELKSTGQLKSSDLPSVPKVYLENIQLSNDLKQLQQDMDEAKGIAQRSKSTYDKLKKQRDFQRINHRRVQQEKLKLNQDIGKLKKK